MTDKFSGNLTDLMKQAKQMHEQMQQYMKSTQEELSKLQITGEAGAGIVKVTLNGHYDVLQVQIADSAYKEDKEFLEDLTAAAFNNAVSKIRQMSSKKMKGMSSQLGLPSDLNLPWNDKE